MKAKIIKAEQFNAMLLKNKETVNTLRVVTVKKGEINEVITARFYMSRSASASVVYCCLWVSGKCSGYGQAFGYGYHKESEALGAAIRSAGIELYGTPYKAGKQRTETEQSYNHETKEYTRTERKIDYTSRAHIGGCGSEAMEAALTDIARDVLGYRKVKVM